MRLNFIYFSLCIWQIFRHFISSLFLFSAIFFIIVAIFHFLRWLFAADIIISFILRYASLLPMMFIISPFSFHFDDVAFIFILFFFISSLKLSIFAMRCDYFHVIDLCRLFDFHFRLIHFDIFRLMLHWLIFAYFSWNIIWSCLFSFSLFDLWGLITHFHYFSLFSGPLLFFFHYYFLVDFSHWFLLLIFHFRIFAIIIFSLFRFFYFLVAISFRWLFFFVLHYYFSLPPIIFSITP